MARALSVDEISETLRLTRMYLDTNPDVALSRLSINTRIHSNGRTYHVGQLLLRLLDTEGNDVVDSEHEQFRQQAMRTLEEMGITRNMLFENAEQKQQGAAPRLRANPGKPPRSQSLATPLVPSLNPGTHSPTVVNAPVLERRSTAKKRTRAPGRSTTNGRSSRTKGTVTNTAQTQPASNSSAEDRKLYREWFVRLNQQELLEFLKKYRQQLIMAEEAPHVNRPKTFDIGTRRIPVPMVLGDAIRSLVVSRDVDPKTLKPTENGVFAKTFTPTQLRRFTPPSRVR